MPDERAQKLGEIYLLNISIILSDSAVTTKDSSSVFFFLRMKQESKDFPLCLWRQYRHAHAEPGIALSSEDASGSQRLVRMHQGESHYTPGNSLQHDKVDEAPKLSLFLSSSPSFVSLKSSYTF